MSFSHGTIQQLLGKIRQNQICLPSIQRAFVWKEDRIEELFDSIYRGYPFGSFLLWKLNEESFQSYSFYKLLQTYSEAVGDLISEEEVNWDNPLYAVIDGQQRLTSLNIGFNGSFVKVQPNGELISKELYFNLLAFLELRDENLDEIHDEDVGEETNESKIKIFRMFTSADAQSRNNSAENRFRKEIWFKVSHFKETNWNVFLPLAEDAFGAGELERENSIRAELIATINAYRTQKQISDAWLIENFTAFKSHITQFVKRIKTVESIGYFEITFSGRLIDITEVFVRINKGVQLSKLDLLFSSLVANWEEGKTHINDLVKNLKDQSYGNLDLEFILRTCLYLSGGNVLFNLKSFKNSTINRIQQNFKIEGDDLMDFETAILTVVQFLNDFSIKSTILTSKNVLIPLIYHVYKGGDLNSIQSRKEAINFIFVSYLQRVFGSHGDSLLSNLRRSATAPDGQLVNHEFNYRALVDEIQEENKRILYQDINEATFENWLDERNTQKDVAHVLQLTRNWDNFQHNMSPQVLHPKSTLSAELVNALGGTNAANRFCSKVSNWALVPNEPSKNGAYTLSAYYNPLTLVQKNTFKDQAVIPEDISLETEHILQFVSARKQALKNILMERLL